MRAARSLDWAHGRLTAHALGAMLGPVTFRLPDGREVAPLYRAPWADAPDPALPGVLRGLTGEWPCVPFGYSQEASEGMPADWQAALRPAEADEEPHGHAANHLWTWEDVPGALALSITYPDGMRLWREIRPVADAAAIDLTLKVTARSACTLPMGLHFTFALDRPVEIRPGAFGFGLTYPGTLEPGASLFAPAARFESLAAVPARGGSSIDARRWPRPGSVEELLQLNHCEGAATLAHDGWAATIAWDAGVFPSLILWLSNRGRQAPPWNGTNLALGMEPVVSPFGMGLATAAGSNPLARLGVPTARAFKTEESLVTRYRLSAALT
jgi:hypothetical protein